MKRFALTITLASLALPAIAAQGIPDAQNRSPAGQDYPYRPACWQLEPRPAADEWNAWGPVIDGTHQNWYGIPGDVTGAQAYIDLEAAGLCVQSGVGVPWVAIEGDDVATEKLTPLEAKKRAVMDEQDDGDSGIGGLIVIALVGAAIWASRDGDDKDDRLPIFVQSHPEVPAHEVLHRAFAPITADVSAVPAIEVIQTVPAVATQVIEPLARPAKQPYDFAGLLAHRLRPTLVTANPRKGKGIVICHAWREAKRRQNASVWLIQPKYHPKEWGYWDGVDQCLGFMAQDYLSAGKKAQDDLCKSVIEFIHRWRQEAPKPSILIFDELSLMKGIFPTWFSSGLVPQILTEMSSGETDDRSFWGITQSPLATDLGITGGNRAPFDLLVIEAEDSGEHLASIAKSYKGMPSNPEPDLYRLSESPKRTIGYHSALNDWFPMMAYPVPNAVRNQPNYVEPIDIEEGESLDSSNYGITSDSVDSLDDVRQLVSSLEPAVIAAVIIELTNGVSDSNVIKNTLGYKAERYGLGKQVLEVFKAVYKVGQND